MKKFTSIKALYACLGILTLFSLSLFSCENSGNGPKLTTISIWYIPSQSEAGEPPADWFLYDKLKKELGIDLKLKALPTDTNELDSIIMQAAKTKRAMTRRRYSIFTNMSRETSPTVSTGSSVQKRTTLS